MFSRDADNATLSPMNRRNQNEPAVFKRFTLYFQRIPLQTILLIFNHKAYLGQSNTLINPFNYNGYGHFIYCNEY